MKTLILLTLFTATLALAQPGIYPEERVPYMMPKSLDYELSFTELCTVGYDYMTYIGDCILVEWPYAYIGCTEWGLMIWDISDPLSPTMLSHTDGDVSEPDLQTGLGDFDIYQDTLLVGELGRIGSEGLIIVNVADVYDPEVVFTYEIPGHLDQTFIYGSFAYQPSGDYYDPGLNGLISYDLSDPSHPIFADSIRTPGAIAKWVSIESDFAYLFDGYSGHDGVDIIDVTDPYNLEYIGFIPHSEIQRGWVHNDYLYCIGSYGSTVYDVSDPTDPIVVTTFAGFPTYSLTFDWPYLYCATGAGIAMVDISIPESTHIAGWQAFSQAWHGTGISDSSLLFANGYYSLGIFHWENTGIEEEPERPDEISVSVYPNPFNESCVFQIPTGASLLVFDISGRFVRSLSGSRAIWDGSDYEGCSVSSGVYLYIVDSQRKRIAGKVIRIN